MEYPEGYAERSRMASAAIEPLLKAVHPIFIKTPHYPEQVGSCVLFSLGENVFILSAAHVLGSRMSQPIYIPDGSAFYQVPATGPFSADWKSGTNANDPIDAVALLLKGEVPESIRTACLTLADLDLESPGDERNFHVVCGYRCNDTKVDAVSIR